MQFLVDTNLPRALAVWLGQSGHEAEHVLDLSLAQTTDAQIWVHANQIGSVIVSKDEDFSDLFPQLRGPLP
jgi:predicted nuclease of predicted toxin-antitoxin system